MNMPNAGTYKRILLYSIAALFALALLLPTLFKQYLATPHAASHISRLLSDTLGQSVVIRQVTFADGTLQLNGLSLANPEDFNPSALLTVASVTVKPEWLKLLSDRRSFQKVTLDVVTLDLRQNSSGVWNFNQLQRRFSSTKPSSTELFIRQLTISKGILQINQHSFSGLALNVSNLANAGSDKSGFNLGFDDSGRNHYTVTGKARLGRDPELELSLSSSSLSLKSLSQVLHFENKFLPEQGNANLQLSAKLQKGIITGQGMMSFDAANVSAAKTADTFNGSLSLTVKYDLQKDRLEIEKLALEVKKLIAARISGNVRELKMARNFTIDIATEEIDIARIAPFIPELERRKIGIGGKLGKSSLHLIGNVVDGVTAAGGKLDFSQGILRQDRKLVFNGLHVTAALSASGKTLTVVGKAIQPQAEAGTILEALDAPYMVTLNRKLKIIEAHSPDLSIKSSGASFNGSISYANDTCRIQNAVLKNKDMSAILGDISARIPLKQVSSKTVRYPLKAVFSKCDIHRSDASLKDLSGIIQGAYAFDPHKKWLEGTAQLKAEKAVWQGKQTGVSTVHAEFSSAGGKAVFKTALLGGSLQGKAVFNPFDLRQKVEFSGNAKGIRLAGITKYAGVMAETTPSAGTLDADWNGSYSGSAGLLCHLEANGQNIALTGKGGKTVFSDAGIKINGEISGQKLIINEARLTIGHNISVKISAALEKAFLPERQGRVAFTLPRTSLSEIVDSMLNILPRSIQEASFEGDLTAEGAVSLQSGKMLVEGDVTLANINLDAPTESIKLSDLNGQLPFSLFLAGQETFKPPSHTVFKRQNYAKLLQEFRQAAEKSAPITIGKASFGGLNLDSINLRLKASQGVTEILSLDSSLYGGSLSGNGFVTAQNGILYRGDMLINDLSLQKLCKAFPAITGYISGRVDGIFSVQGKGGNLSGLSGFSELWARETAIEKMLVSREFLQRLADKKLSGFFFSSDRAYDHAGIKATLQNGYLNFDSLDISHTNFLGIRDLSVTIAPSQNRIAIDHLVNSIKEATTRGKSTGGAAGKDQPAPAPVETEFKWND